MPPYTRNCVVERSLEWKETKVLTDLQHIVGLQSPFRETELKVSGKDKNYLMLIIASPVSL